MAGARRGEALGAGKRPQHGHAVLEQETWLKERRSSGAELAVARELGAAWSGYIPGLKGNPPDVGEDVEVRHTTYQSGHLILHDDDPDDRVYVLVTGDFPEYEIRGWLPGREAKRKKWWNYKPLPAPGYTVPQSALRSFEELRCRTG